MGVTSPLFNGQETFHAFIVWTPATTSSKLAHKQD